MKKSIIAILLLSLLATLIINVVFMWGLDPVTATLIAGALILVSVSATFGLIDVLSPQQPSQLNSEDVKALFQSKIFWGAFLMLMSIVARVLFKIDIDQETQDTIINLDWSDWIGAVFSIVVMAVRKYDLLKLIR